MGEHKDNAQVVAVKTIKKSLFDAKPDLQRKVRREIALMQLTSHPHLLELYDVYESGKHLHMVLEYAAHGELFDYLVSRRRLELPVAIAFFRQLIFGLDYLHKHYICHRDLKPENILLDSHDQVKVADFGFARWMRSLTAETSCGSPHYASPEVIRGNVYDGRAADMWSCGVILYALLAGRLPFDDPNIRALLSKVKSGRYQMPDSFDDRVKDLISRLLELDCDVRLSIDQVKAHPAFHILLPDSYSIPCVLPPVSLYGAVQLPPSDSQILVVLRGIGYQTEQEILSELASPDPTPAKTFYWMWKSQLSFEALPWDAAREPLDAGQGERPLIVSPHQPLLAMQSPQLDQYGRAMKVQAQSPGSVAQSLAERATWLGDTRQVQSEDESGQGAEWSVVAVPLEWVLATLQHAFDADGIQWFHHTDLDMIIKNPELETYISLHADRIETEQSDFQMTLLRGDGGWFQAFVSEVQAQCERASAEYQAGAR